MVAKTIWMSPEPTAEDQTKKVKLIIKKVYFKGIPRNKAKHARVGEVSVANH